MRLTILSIGNGQYIGGGMKAVPDAVIDDGLLDAIAVEGIDSRLKIATLLPRFISGTHARTCPGARHALQSSHHPLPRHDGEPGMAN